MDVAAMLSRRTLTKQEEASITNAVLIVSHWIRTILDDSTVSYKWERNLMEIVVKHYFTAIFEWDPLRSSPHLELSPDGRSFRYKAGPNTDPGKSLCSKNILCSADNISSVRWELTVKQQGDQFYMLMGFVSTDGLFNPNENCFIGTDEHQWALWVVDGSFPLVMQDGHRGEWNNGPISHKTFGISVNDRFELRFDFRAQKCTAYYNGGLLGEVADGLPKEIYLAATVTVDVLETTLFEVS